VRQWSPTGLMGGTESSFLSLEGESILYIQFARAGAAFRKELRERATERSISKGES
jgi:hypothetical protein